MKHLISNRWQHAAMGALLITLAGACSDVPTSPIRHLPMPEFPGLPAPRAADLPVLDAGLTSVRPGESIRRRTIRLSDGRQYVMESVLDAGGLPREIRVSRDGQSVARLENAWRRTSKGFALERQRLVRYSAGQAARAADSRDFGSVTELANGEVVLPFRAQARRVARSDVTQAVRMRSLAEEYFGGGGPCDAEARAVEDAIDSWLLSVLAVAGTTLTGSPVAAWSAYAYQLKKYRDLTRSETALDECVAKAGQPMDEY